MPKTATKLPTKTRKQTSKTAGITHRPRRLQLPKRLWYNPLTWHHRPPVPAYRPLPKARVLFWTVLKLLWANWQPFLGIALIYGVLNLLLVRDFSGSGNLTGVKNQLDSLLHGRGLGGELAGSAATYVALLSSSGSSGTATAGVYQTILFIVCSLAFIWALRQVLAKHAVRVRDSFYQGMYPLIPFVLTLLFLGLQLLPLVIGGSLYTFVVGNGIAAHAWEKLIAFTLFVLLGLWSLRMITATIFALYIVSLPNMTPLSAYRNARRLVYGRRLLLWRKLIFLPVVLFVLATLIELPLIFFVTPVAAWMFFVLTTLALPVVHSYLYNLYREML